MIFSEFDDPSVVSQHNRGLMREFRKRRLEKRLRGNRKPRSARRLAVMGLLARGRRDQNASKSPIL